MAIFTHPVKQYANENNLTEAQVIEQIQNDELNGYENYGDWFVRLSDGVEKPILRTHIPPHEILYRSRIGHSDTYQDQHGQKWIKVAGIYKKVDATYIPKKVVPLPKTATIMPTVAIKVPCAKCNKLVQQDITKCPHCGAERPADSLSTTLISGVGGLVFLAIIYFGIKWMFSGSSEPKPKKAQMPTASYAYFKCQNSVKLLLKAPSSADFGSIANTSIQQLRTGMRGKKYEIQYQVNGYVDSQNSFGAMIRNNYRCKVTGQTGNKWRLDDVSMG